MPDKRAVRYAPFLHASGVGMPLEERSGGMQQWREQRVLVVRRQQRKHRAIQHYPQLWWETRANRSSRQTDAFRNLAAFSPPTREGAFCWRLTPTAPG